MKLFAWSMVLLVLTEIAYAAPETQTPPLDVTSVVCVKDRVKTSRSRVVIGGFLAIESITVYRDGSIKLPHYRAKNGYEYPQIEFLNSLLEQRVVNAIKTGNEPGEEIENPVITYAPFDIIEAESKRVANVRVLFNNEVAVTCGVMKGKRGPWIAWPSIQDNDGKTRLCVYVLKKTMRKNIETALVDQYTAARDAGKIR